MTVYVDPPIVYGRRVGPHPPDTPWCHMWADDLEELHAMAEAIGMQRAWFQDRKELPHYDLVPSRRAAAVARGAVEVDHAFLVRWMEATADRGP